MHVADLEAGADAQPYGLKTIGLAGRLHHDETFVDGLENALNAVNGLFQGTNTGKLLVRVTGA